MPIAIHRATDADCVAISALNADVQGFHAERLPQRFKPPGPGVFPPEEVREVLAKPDHHVLLATVGGVPAGYVYVELLRRPDSSATHPLAMTYIHHISVRPAFRRQGVGRALIAAARALGRNVGIGLVGLDVWTFNEPARAFFRRCGLAAYTERMWDLEAK
jgi:ribosomal protein S18 acetylase RimI-like enzyme